MTEGTRVRTEAAPQPDAEVVAAFDTIMAVGEDEPRTRATFVGAMILDRPPDMDRLRHRLDGITRRVRRMRQRIVFPAVGGVTSPRWVVDPDFDLNFHLRRVALPSPGSHEQLLGFIEPLLMSSLDKSRPLWEAYVVEGLDGGRAAFIGRFSHALFDGIGVTLALAGLYDSEPDRPERPLPPPPVPEDVTPTELTRAAIPRLPLVWVRGAERTVRSVTKAGYTVTRHPRRTLGSAAALGNAVRGAIGPSSSHRSPLMQGRSPRRRCFTLQVPVAGLKAGGRAAGGSLNDAYLAAVAGAVGSYHRAHATPIDTFALAFPVSVRSDADDPMSNRWTAGQIQGPAGIEDPAARVAAVHAEAAAARAAVTGHDVLGHVTPLVARLPRWAITELSSSVTNADIQASNVPGWTDQLYVAGAKLEEVYPFGPLPGVAAMIALLSISGTCYIGVNYDPAAIVHGEQFADSLRTSFDEIIALAD